MRLLLVLLLTLSGALLTGCAAPAGAETFRNPTRIPLPHTLEQLQVADVNGDGRPDLIAVTQATPALSPQLFLDVLLAQPDGTFLAEPEITMPANTAYYCKTADVNNDGKVDLVCPNYNDVQFSSTVTMVTYFGDGDGTFQSPILYTFTAPNSLLWAYTIVGSGVLTGSGHTDLLLLGNDGFGYLLKGDGTGHFTLGFYPAQNGSATVADVNGDGKPDLLFNVGPSVLLGHGDGTFTSPNQFLEYGPCLFQDVTGGGQLDAVCGALGKSLVVLGGRADGTFSDPLALTLADPLQQVIEPLAYVDLNHDGHPDVVGISSDGLAVMLGTGQLSFAAPQLYTEDIFGGNGGTYGNNVALADMNGDGVPDLVTAGEGAVLITYGRADGSFDGTPAYRMGELVDRATVADFNGDGVPDVVTGGLGPVTVRLGVGDGTFLPAMAQPLGEEAGYGGLLGTDLLLHGDFNGDGRQDVVATGTSEPANPNSNGLFSFLGAGDGTFAAPAASAAYVGARQGTVADLNLDGRDDLLGTEFTQGMGYVDVALAAPDGTFPGPVLRSALPEAASGYQTAVLLGDFNGDGLLDVVGVGNGNLYFLAGRGDGTFAAARTAGTVPNAWTTAYTPVTGDFDGDGHTDVALVSFGGTVLVYFGDGSGGFAGPVTTAALPASIVDQNDVGQPVVADFDGDGRDDLALTFGADIFTEFDGVAVMHGQAGRTFGSPTFFEAGVSLGQGSAADLNGDGFPDMVFPNVDSAVFSPLLNLPGAALGHVLAASPEPSKVGQAFALTVRFPPPAGAAEAQVGGSVAFAVDGVAVGSATISNNVATLAGPTTLTAGLHAISATWAGDAVYAGVVLRGTHRVIRVQPALAAVTLTLQAAPNPVTVGQPVTLTAGVANAGVGTAPTGRYTLTDGGTVLASGDASGGPVTKTVTYAAVGTHVLTLQYAGDAAHTPASTTLTLVVVAAAATSVTVTPAPSPGLQAHAVTVGIAVAGAGMPTGSVQVLDGGTGLGTVALNGGQGSLTVSGLAVGTHELVAEYAGDARNAAATGQASEVILPYDFSLTASGPSGTVTAGSGATALLTVTAVGAFAEGVELTVSGVPAGLTATLGQSTVQVPAGGAGTTTLTIGLAPTMAERGGGPGGWLAGIGLASLLPLLGCSRTRRMGMLAMLLVAGMTVGCGGTEGYPVASTSYTLVVTGTSAGTGQSHSVTVTGKATTRAANWRSLVLGRAGRVR